MLATDTKTKHVAIYTKNRITYAILLDHILTACLLPRPREVEHLQLCLGFDDFLV